jgi:hypothetical protein
MLQHTHASPCEPPHMTSPSQHRPHLILLFGRPWLASQLSLIRCQHAAHGCVCAVRQRYSSPGTCSMWLLLAALLHHMPSQWYWGTCCAWLHVCACAAAMVTPSHHPAAASLGHTSCLPPWPAARLRVHWALVVCSRPALTGAGTCSSTAAGHSQCWCSTHWRGGVSHAARPTMLRLLLIHWHA